MGETAGGLSAFEPGATRRLPEAGAVIRQVLAAHALLMSESDLSPRNDRINQALRNLVGLLLLPYSPSQAAAILGNDEIAAIRTSLIERLSQAELALEWFWSERFLGRKTLGLHDLTAFTFWQNYERLLGLELQALTELQRLQESRNGRGGVVFVGGGPLPLSAILHHMQTGGPVVCVDRDAEACESARRLISKLGLSAITALHADGAGFDYGGFSTISIASLVEEKTAVSRRIVSIGKRALVAVRTVEGVRTLLYRPADVLALQAVGLALAGRTEPGAEAINATIFFNAGLD